MNYNDHNPSNEFLDSFVLNSSLPNILQPTRIIGHSKTIIDNIHRVKSVRIRSYSGPYFAAFGLNTERYRAIIQSESCSDYLLILFPIIHNYHPQFLLVPDIRFKPLSNKSNIYEKGWSIFHRKILVLIIFPLIKMKHWKLMNKLLTTPLKCF